MDTYFYGKAKTSGAFAKKQKKKVIINLGNNGHANVASTHFHFVNKNESDLLKFLYIAEYSYKYSTFVYSYTMWLETVITFI